MPNLTIPLEPNPSYSFEIELDGVLVEFDVHWNSVAESWFFNMKNDEIGLELNGLKMVGGVDLLEAYAVRELGQLFAVDVEGLNDDPNFDDVGDRFRLLYIGIDNAPLQ